MDAMPVILDKDLTRGRSAFEQWKEAARMEHDPHTADPALPDPSRPWPSASRSTCWSRRRPVPASKCAWHHGVPSRYWTAPHPTRTISLPDVIELDPDVWLRLASGITSWAEEKEAGHITAVGERDDLSALLPLY